ncbi:MAG: hypothetical protein WC916_05595 [Candidatus Woesearchaeota archaeon]
MLKLNEPHHEYSVFDAGLLKIRSHLYRNGFTVLSMAELMQRKLDVLTSTPEVKDSWWSNSFCTRDAALYHPDGRLKISLDSEIFLEQPSVPVIERHFEESEILYKNAFEKLLGEELNKADVAKYTDTLGEKHFSLTEILNNPIWRALARDDKLLEEYARATLKEAEKWWGKGEYQQFVMGISRPAQDIEQPVLKLWRASNFVNSKNGICGHANPFNPHENFIARGPKIYTPALEQIIAIGSKYVAPMNIEALREEIEPLYVTKKNNNVYD